MKRVVVETLIYDKYNSQEDFETFLTRVVERLKALRYYPRLTVKILRGNGEVELLVETEDLFIRGGEG